MVLLMSDEYPRIRVVFGGDDVAREPLTIHVDEFIGVKSCKAKGKRLTTYQVEKVEELEPYIPDILVAEATDEETVDDSADLEEPANEDAVQDTEAPENEMQQGDTSEQDEALLIEKEEQTQTEKTVTSKGEIETLPQKDGQERESDNLDVNEIKMEIVAEIPEDSLPMNENQEVQPRTKRRSVKTSKSDDEKGQMSLF